jgi:phosphatidylinositol-3-phosphatase
MPARRLLAAVASALLLTACGSSSDSSGSAPSGPTPGGDAASTAGIGESASGGQVVAPRPCGTAADATYRHVVWIWMENRSYSSVINGAGDAPELERYADLCGLATDYHGITHPSLPNYIAATAGSPLRITTDCGPDDCPRAKSSLFGQVRHAGKSWFGYAESMTSRCDHAGYGTYAPRHNPAVYFTPIAAQCRKRDVPMGGRDGRFAHALANGLPAFSFVTPNLCHDGHDCATGVADTWLGRWLDRITASDAYAAGDTAVFVTWDESELASQRNHIATVVIAPTVSPGLRVDLRFDHYSLLRTTEQLLGLPFLRHAKNAHSMRAAFGL